MEEEDNLYENVVIHCVAKKREIIIVRLKDSGSGYKRQIIVTNGRMKQLKTN